jgi:DNA-binding MarR family transcriptional regulator
MTQTLTGQDIGQAAIATRAVLNRVLAGFDIAFEQSVILNLLGRNESPMTDDDLVARVVHGLKIAEPAAREVLATLLDRGLAERTEDGGQLALTSSGTERFEQITGAIGQITERLYGGLPPEELAVAHRMLTTVTARANAELAEPAVS